MEVIPAIDLIGGKCVRLTRGDYAREKVYSGDPVAQALKFYEQGARSLHLIDLDGARQGKAAHLFLIDALRKTRGLDGMRIEFGGGIRTMEMARIAINKGADMVIVGTAAYRNPAFLAELVKELPESCAIAVDVRNGGVVVEGWVAEAGMGKQESIVSNLGKEGVKTIIYTDTEKDGTLSGVGVTGIGFVRVMERCKSAGIRVQYAGGVRDIKDIRELKRFQSQGLYGIVTGKALYEGTLDLAGAIREGQA